MIPLPCTKRFLFAKPTMPRRGSDGSISVEWEGDFKPVARQGLKHLLEQRLEEEMAQYLGLSRYERAVARPDYRNGHYVRHLLTEMGDLELLVPRSRKGAAKVQNKILLCAFGITVDGEQEMIDFHAAASESQACWESFLNDLYNRGLTGSGLKLIATDGGTGLDGALQIVYPNILTQRCWAHKTRNVLDKVKKTDQPAVKKALSRISHAQNQRQARAAYARLVLRWNRTYPRAVRCLEKDLDELLSFFQIQNSKLWGRLRTTNLIERAFREVRRRTRPMGVMANTQSLQRIVFAVFHHLNQNWSLNPIIDFTHNS